jgi:PTH1 family peptidyl-tRNA hydrolase
MALFSILGVDALWLIVGLGNPGAKYSRTKHNVGFWVVDSLAKSHGVRVVRKCCDSSVGRGVINRQDAILAKPRTFMNRSGIAVRCLMEHYNIDLSRLVVIYDDLDLNIGTLRIRGKGGHGGHNGMRSILNELGTCEFSRIRVGIGNDNIEQAAEDYVLSSFNKDDEVIVFDTVAKACRAVEVFVKEGLDACMNQFNQRGIPDS